MNDLVLTALAATLWCALHSLLITPGFEAWLQRRVGPRAAWHRLAYTLFSTITLIAVWFLFHRHPGDPLWQWHGPWQLLRWTLLLAAATLGWLGARRYDGGVLLGLQQVRDLRAGRTPPPPRFSRDGVLGLIRHPWYAAGLLILAVGLDYTTTNVVWRGIFVLYLLVGTQLEERKLVRTFGDDYRAYQREVPAFLPRLRRPGPR